MSVLERAQNALQSLDFPIGEGAYPETSDDCGKIVYAGTDKFKRFLGGNTMNAESIKVVLRGNSYRALEHKADLVISALKNAGFIQIGGYEDVEPKQGETFMQLAVTFKSN